MPSGGDGYYYFSAFLTVDGGKFGYFDVEVNGELVCTVDADVTESPTTDEEISSCSGVTYAVEGILGVFF